MLKEQLGDLFKTDEGQGTRQGTNLVLNGPLYQQYWLKDDVEDLHQFVVLKPHHIVAFSGCHPWCQSLRTAMQKSSSASTWTGHTGSLWFKHTTPLSAMNGCSPQYLMLGHWAQIPIDIRSSLHWQNTRQLWNPSYIQGLNKVQKQRLHSITGIMTRELMLQSWESGDLVLLRIGRYRGKRKVVDQWHSQPWKVVCHQLMMSQHMYSNGPMRWD